MRLKRRDFLNRSALSVGAAAVHDSIMATAQPAPVAREVRRSAANSEFASKIDALFEPLATQNSPGVSAMVIHRGQTIYARARGLANLEERIPASIGTNYRLASLTKQFTAMASLILTEKRLLTLEERLTDVFPEFPVYGRQVLIRHLLTHTSGLIDYEDIVPKGTSIPVLDQDVLRLLMTQDKTYFVPGTSYRYSNSGYALLALAVEQRSGLTFARYLKQHIFSPLRMTNTLAYEQGLSIVPMRAYGYSPDGNSFKRTDQSLTSSVLGDGGIYSSLADLYKWDQALYADRIVHHKTIQQAFTAATVTDKKGINYGFGWFIGEYRRMKEIWHYGETVGFRTRISRFPKDQFTVILLANRSDALLDEYPRKIVDIVLF